jgi:dUTP pyrophosphatase
MHVIKFIKTQTYPFDQTPVRAHDSDLGYDLVACDIDYIDASGSSYPSYQVGCVQLRVCFGVAMEIPDCLGGFVFPRSSIKNYPFLLTNSVGVIDPHYRGEIKAFFHITTPQAECLSRTFNVGERCAQLVFFERPKTQMEQCDQLTPSKRGSGGYGSSGTGQITRQ